MAVEESQCLKPSSRCHNGVSSGFHDIEKTSCSCACSELVMSLQKQVKMLERRLVDLESGRNTRICNCCMTITNSPDDNSNPGDDNTVLPPTNSISTAHTNNPDVDNNIPIPVVRTIHTGKNGCTHVADNSSNIITNTARKKLMTRKEVALVHRMATRTKATRKSTSKVNDMIAEVLKQIIKKETESTLEVNETSTFKSTIGLRVSDELHASHRDMVGKFLSSGLDRSCQFLISKDFTFGKEGVAAAILDECFLDSEIVDGYCHSIVTRHEDISFESNNEGIYSLVPYTRTYQCSPRTEGMSKELVLKFVKADASCVFFPVRLNNYHWVLIVADVKNYQWHLYDSMYTQDTYDFFVKTVNRVNPAMTSVTKAHTYLWPFIVHQNVRQPDIASCGVFVCKWVEQIVHQKPQFPSTPDEIMRYRYEIASVVISCSDFNKTLS